MSTPKSGGTWMGKNGDVVPMGQEPQDDDERFEDYLKESADEPTKEAEVEG